MVSPYWQSFHTLRGVYLERSRVLSVRGTRHELVFELDAILTPSHPAYRGPAYGQEHDYRICRLELAGDEVTYTAAVDGSPLAHIEDWSVDDDGWSRLRGAWGSARLRCLNATLVLSLP